MKARMEELNVFYDDHLDDEKIHFFEKLRLKLKKTLQLKPNVLESGNLKMRQSIIQTAQQYQSMHGRDTIARRNINADLRTDMEPSDEVTEDEDLER